MNLLTHSVRQNIEKVQECEQVTFDHDYVIKDNKPDALRIVCQNGWIKVDEVKSAGENIWVSGNIEFELLYKGENTEGKAEAVKDVIPFQEKIVLEGVCDGDSIRVYAALEDLSIGIINSRKLFVRGIINMDIYAEHEECIAVAQKADEPGVEQLTKEVSLLELECQMKDILRVKCEANLPKTKPNIWKLLCSMVDIRNVDYTYERERVTLTGECHVCVIYLSEEQEICCFETQESFTNEIKCDSAEPGNIAWLRVQLATQQIETENDYDGEPRQLSIELAIAVDGKVWSEEKINILEDMYSVSKTIRPLPEDISVTRLLMKNQTKCRILEQLYRDSQENRIMRICGIKANAQLEQIKQTDNGIIVSGVLVVNCINIVEDDSCPIEMHTDQIPFEQFVEIPGINCNTYTETSVIVDQVQVNLMDNCEYEIKAIVGINAIALQQETVRVINSVEEEEISENEQNTTGLVGYIVQKGEKLWDIAKKYHTTIDNIMTINSLSSDEIQQNDRLIIANMGRIG